MKKSNMQIISERKKEKKEPLYIFLHVMKCAGSTIKMYILKNLKNNTLLLYNNTEPLKSIKGEKNNQTTEKYIRSLSQDEKDKIKIIFGHCVYYGIHELFPDREARYITFLRNPVDRTISQYNFSLTMIKKGIYKEVHIPLVYKNKKLLSFKEWFIESDFPKNYMSKFLFIQLVNSSFDKNKDIFTIENLEEVKKILNKFYFVGIVENPQDFSFLYDKLKIKNSSEKDNVSNNFLSPQEMKNAENYLCSELKYDIQIYEYAKILNKSFKNEKKSSKLFQSTPSFSIREFIIKRLYKISSIIKRHSKFYIHVIDVIKKETQRARFPHQR